MLVVLTTRDMSATVVAVLPGKTRFRSKHVCKAMGSRAVWLSLSLYAMAGWQRHCVVSHLCPGCALPLERMVRFASRLAAKSRLCCCLSGLPAPIAARTDMCSCLLSIPACIIVLLIERQQLSAADRDVIVRSDLRSGSEALWFCRRV